MDVVVGIWTSQNYIKIWIEEMALASICKGIYVQFMRKDRYFKDQMTLEQYYKVNYEMCKEIRRWEE